MKEIRFINTIQPNGYKLWVNGNVFIKYNTNRSANLIRKPLLNTPTYNTVGNI